VLVFASCKANSKFSSAKQQRPARMSAAMAESTGYPYPSVYRNVGTVTLDTVARSH
jgi:hypothetical protein